MKKKTKARGKHDYSIANRQTRQRKKGETRRKRETQKKTAKQKKNNVE